MSSGPAYETLMKEMKKKLKEAKASADKIGKQDEEFERLAKLDRKACAEELRALRKELSPRAISKMPKHAIINEIIRLKHAIESDVHVDYQKEDVDDAKKKGEKKFIEKRADLPAKEVQKLRPQESTDSYDPIIPSKSRKASAIVLRVAAKRKEGLSLKDAWAAVKAEDAKKTATRDTPAVTAAASRARHSAEVEAVIPASHKREAAAARRAKERAHAKANPGMASLAELMRKGYSLAEAAKMLKEKK